MKNALILLGIVCLLFSCQKEQPATQSTKFTWGDPTKDTVKYQNRDVDNPPQPAQNWVTLMNATVTSYTLDFSWIWGKSNIKQGGGSLDISHITIHPPVGGFAVSSATYTNFTGSALATITITGHPTHAVMNSILHILEIVKDSELVTIVSQWNANTGYFNMSVTTKK